MKPRWWILFPILGALASVAAELIVPARVPDRLLSIVLGATFVGWILREIARG